MYWIHFPYLIRASSICRIARIEFAITSPLSCISPVYALILFEKSLALISTHWMIARRFSASCTGSNTNCSTSGAADGTLCENVVSVFAGGVSVCPVAPFVSGFIKWKIMEINGSGGGNRTHRPWGYEPHELPLLYSAEYYPSYKYQDRAAIASMTNCVMIRILYYVCSDPYPRGIIWTTPIE